MDLYSRYEEAYQFEMNRRADLSSHVTMITPIVGGLIAALFYLVSQIESMNVWVNRISHLSFLISMLCLVFQVVVLCMAYRIGPYVYINHPSEIEKYKASLEKHRLDNELDEMYVNKSLENWYQLKIIDHTTRNGSNNDKRQKLIRLSNYGLMTSLFGTAVLTILYAISLLIGD
jgi:hypothetical protein